MAPRSHDLYSDVACFGGSSADEESGASYYCRVTSSPLVPIREFTIPLPHYLEEDYMCSGLTPFELPDEEDGEEICLMRRKRRASEEIFSTLKEKVYETASS